MHWVYCCDGPMFCSLCADVLRAAYCAARGTLRTRWLEIALGVSVASSYLGGNVAFLSALRRKRAVEVRMAIASNVAFALGLSLALAAGVTKASARSRFGRAPRSLALLSSRDRQRARARLAPRPRCSPCAALLPGLAQRDAWEGEAPLKVDVGGAMTIKWCLRFTVCTFIFLQAFIFSKLWGAYAVAEPPPHAGARARAAPQLASLREAAAASAAHGLPAAGAASEKPHSPSPLPCGAVWDWPSATAALPIVAAFVLVWTLVTVRASARRARRRGTGRA